MEYNFLGQAALTTIFTITNEWAQAAKTAAIAAAKTYTDTEIGKLPTYKAGTGIAIADDGTISATGDATVDPSALPLASKTQQGAVIIGDGIEIVDGKISVTHPDVYTKTEANERFQTAAQVETIAKAEVAKIVDGAPEAFDTLKEIADALNKDTEGGIVNGLITAINNAKDDAITAAGAAADTKTEAAKSELTAEIAKKATPADVAAAKQEAITAAAADAAKLYQTKADMPTFREFTAEEIRAIADAAIAAA